MVQDDSMKTKLFAILHVILFASIATPPEVYAQFSAEARIGGAMPTGELSDSPGLNQTAGLSFALDGMYTFTPNVTAYVGGARQNFHCDGCSVDVNTTGFEGGLKYVFPTEGAAAPWVRGGVMLHRASVDGDNQDWGAGVDAGGGVDWLIRPDLALVPALRVNSYNSGSLSLTFVTLDLGLHLHFGEL